MRSEARSLPALGSEKPWHQTSSPRRIGGQVRWRCSGVPSAMMVGPAWSRPDEVHPDVGGVGPLELLFEDELLDRRRAPAAALDRPVDPGVAGVEQQPLPVGVVGAPARPVVGGRLGRQVGQRVGQPPAQLGSERLLGVGVAQVHGAERVTR